MVETPLQVVCGAVIRNGRCLVAQKAAHHALGGRWEFPGGKLESGESHPQALRRELKEELGLDVEPVQRVAAVDGATSAGIPMRLELWLCRPGERPPEANQADHQAILWTDASQRQGLAWAPLDAKLLPFLEEALRSSSAG